MSSPEPLCCLRATCYVLSMVLPSIPLSREALARATCDGLGLISLPTDVGVELGVCPGCRHCTSRPMPTPSPSPHVRMVELLRALRCARSREEMNELWEANQDIWDDWLTRVGRYRLAALEAS